MYYFIFNYDISLQGKGKILTYFLVGKDGYTGKQPDLSRAATMKDHTFK